jgi:nitroreductase
MHTIDAIRTRKTTKVLAGDAWEPSLTEHEQKELCDHLLTLAAEAPYHYKSAERYKIGEQTSSLPFRCYTLDGATCNALATKLEALDPPPGKILNMLWAAELLVLTTWLPDVFGAQPEERIMEPLPFVGNLRNMEHIAATSAAIQNMLLGATSEGYPNYWSSGGVLRQETARNMLHISMEEVMLGAVFIFPKDAVERAEEIKPGKLRKEGKVLGAFSKKVRL